MSHQPDTQQPDFSEPMVARVEIEELGDATIEKQLTDAIAALPGVTDVKIQKGAMHVSYDPLTTTEKKIEQAVRSSGNTVKVAATDTQTPHPPNQ